MRCKDKKISSRLDASVIIVHYIMFVHARISACVCVSRIYKCVNTNQPEIPSRHSAAGGAEKYNNDSYIKRIPRSLRTIITNEKNKKKKTALEV